MRLKFFLIITPLLALTAPLFAKPFYDSVGVENQNGKKIILHKVEPKETYYAIGRRYGVNPNAILNFNDRVPLQPGATIKVPTDLPFSEPVKTAAKNASAQPAVQTTQDYKVGQGETLYAISRRFNVTVDEIKAANNLSSNNLTPGQILHIKSGSVPATVTAPVKEIVAETKPVATPPPAYHATVQTPANTPAQATQDYKVSAGETLYSIAKRFSTTTENIKALNNMQNDNIIPGQILHVPAGTTNIGNAPAVVVQTPAVPDPNAYRPQPYVAKRDTTRVTAPVDTAATGTHSANGRFGLNEKDEKGVGTWLDDTMGLDPNKKLVLHRTAPIGTVIKITNPMSNRTTYAKVVGRFNDNEATKDVIIVMTKNVAESLGALDKRFHVVITYGVPNE